MVVDDIHSRSRLAGYIPEILFKSSVLVVGAGALGQNLALDLALAGVGEIIIVDFDVFEPHNATRSPLYPNLAEISRWGYKKSKVVAHKLLPLMTAPKPKVWYVDDHVQALGDSLLSRVQLVFSAVDDDRARVYLARRCHVARRPLIEGGFFAENLNVSVFGPNAADPCFCCTQPELENPFSCRLYALEAEAQEIIPAIQNTAAVLGGLQAELGIQHLHGEDAMQGKMCYVNIHAMQMSTSLLTRVPECIGIHWPEINLPFHIVDIQGDDTVKQLLKAVEDVVGPAQIYFPEDIVMTTFCTHCGEVTYVNAPAWQWLACPCCTICGGPFERGAGFSLSNKVWAYTDEEDDDILALQCSQVGMPSGTVCEVLPTVNSEKFGTRYLMQLKGTTENMMTRVIDGIE